MLNSARQPRTVARSAKGLIFAALILPLGIASVPAMANGIQMLPPVTEATKTYQSDRDNTGVPLDHDHPTTCPAGAPNVLTWDGTNPISCATGVTVTNGNVGIGTTNPQGVLQMQGNTPNGVLEILGNSNAGSRSYAELQLSNDVAQRAGAIQISSSRNSIFPNKMEIGTIVNGPLELYTNDIVRMIIDTSGNVGIGTTSPGSALQVNGGAAIGYATNTAAPSNGLAVSGNVGIGTTSPETPLDVVGPIRTTDNSTTCTSQNGGALRYNTSTNVFEGCSLTAQGWNWGQLGQDNRKWYDMTTTSFPFSSYAPDTTYTNNNAWPIDENVSVICKSSVFWVTVNGVRVGTTGAGAGITAYGTISFSVPAQAQFSYSATFYGMPPSGGCEVVSGGWAEFR